MNTRFLVSLACCCLSSQAEEHNRVEASLELLEQSHRTLVSYLAHYQVHGSEGKSIALTIAQDRREGLSAVIMEFFKDGEDPKSMINLTSPDLGLIAGPPEAALQYSDMQLVFEKLQAVLKDEQFENLETPVLRWTPSFHLSKSDINTGLHISSSKNLPWRNSELELPEGTIVREDGQELIFLTPAEVSYRINRESGMLIEQSFEENPERKVSLRNLKLNPASDEIRKLIEQHLPEKTKTESFAQSPAFLQLNLVYAGALVAAVDKGEVSPADFQKFLIRARPALGEYLGLALPDCHSLILPEERWQQLFDSMLSIAREQFEKQDSSDPNRLEWGEFKSKTLLEQREPIANRLLKSLAEGLKLEDIVTEEQLDAETIDGFTAIEMLYTEVKRAMVYAAIQSAIKKYWDGA